MTIVIDTQKTPPSGINAGMTENQEKQYYCNGEPGNPSTPDH
jgi:hypothetical protein